MSSIFSDVLGRLLALHAEVSAAILVDWEGEMVDMACRTQPKDPTDVRLAAAHWAVVMQLAQQSAKRMHAGDLSEMSFHTADSTIVTRQVGSEFRVIVMTAAECTFSVLRRDIEAVCDDLASLL